MIMSWVGVFFSLSISRSLFAHCFLAFLHDVSIMSVLWLSQCYSILDMRQFIQFDAIIFIIFCRNCFYRNGFFRFRFYCVFANDTENPFATNECVKSCEIKTPVTIKHKRKLHFVWKHLYCLA